MAVGTADAGKSAAPVAAVEVALHNFFDDQAEGARLPLKAAPKDKLGNRFVDSGISYGIPRGLPQWTSAIDRGGTAMQLVCKSCLVTLLVFSLLGCGGTNAPADEKAGQSDLATTIAQGLDEWLTRRVPESGVPGAAAVVTDRNGIVWEKAAGRVDGRRILREDLIRQYHAIPYPRPGQRTGYCLGIYREAVSTTYSLSHQGGGKCGEFLPGLFFTYDGEALDFRSDPPTWANTIIRKQTAVPQCGGKMRVIAFLIDYAVVDRIIGHLLLTFFAERSPPPHIAYQGVLMAAETPAEYFS